MSYRTSFLVKQAWSESIAFLPRGVAGAWLSLLFLWAFVAVAPPVLMHQMPHPRLMDVGVLIVSALMKMIALGALYRLALFGDKARGEGLGFGGLQFGAPEVRLVGANIMIALFVALIAATLFIVFAIAANIAGMDVGEMHAVMSSGAFGGVVHVARPETWAICLYLLASLGLLAFLVIKFALAHAATVAERRLVTLNALGLSSGNVGKLFGGLLVLILPLLALGAASFHYLHPRFVLSPRSPAFDAGQTVHMLCHAALMAVAVFVAMPLCVGFLSSAYRQIVKSRAL